MSHHSDTDDSSTHPHRSHSVYPWSRAYNSTCTSPLHSYKCHYRKYSDPRRTHPHPWCTYDPSSRAYNCRCTHHSTDLCRCHHCDTAASSKPYKSYSRDKRTYSIDTPLALGNWAPYKVRLSRNDHPKNRRHNNNVCHSWSRCRHSNTCRHWCNWPWSRWDCCRWRYCRSMAQLSDHLWRAVRSCNLWLGEKCRLVKRVRCVLRRLQIYFYFFRILFG